MSVSSAAPVPMARQGIVLPKLYYQFLLALMFGMVARTTLFARKRDVIEYSTVDASSLVAIAMVAVSLVAVMVAPWVRDALQRAWSGSLKYLLIYYLLSMASALWSLGPMYSLYRSVEVASQLVLAVVIIAPFARDFLWAERAFIGSSLAIISMSVVMNVLIAEQVSLLALHTNVYSSVAAMLCVYATGEWLGGVAPDRKRLLKWTAIAAAFFCMLGTSAGSNVSLLVGLASMAFMQRLYSRPLLLMGIVLLFLIALLSGAVDKFLWDVLLFGKQKESVGMLTGRLYLWDAYIAAIKNEPVLGYGFAIVSRIGEQFGTVSTTNAHNGFLEIMLGSGLVGAAAITFWLGGMAFEWLGCMGKGRPGSVGVGAAMLTVCVNNNTIPIFGGIWNVTSTAFFLLLALFVVGVRGEGQVDKMRPLHNPLLNGKSKDFKV